MEDELNCSKEDYQKAQHLFEDVIINIAQVTQTGFFIHNSNDGNFNNNSDHASIIHHNVGASAHSHNYNNHGHFIVQTGQPSFKDKNLNTIDLTQPSNVTINLRPLVSERFSVENDDGTQHMEFKNALYHSSQIIYNDGFVDAKKNKVEVVVPVGAGEIQDYDKIRKINTVIHPVKGDARSYDRLRNVEKNFKTQQDFPKLSVDQDAILINLEESNLIIEDIKSGNLPQEYKANGQPISVVKRGAGENKSKEGYVEDWVIETYVPTREGDYKIANRYILNNSSEIENIDVENLVTRQKYEELLPSERYLLTDEVMSDLHQIYKDVEASNKDSYTYDIQQKFVDAVEDYTLQKYADSYEIILKQKIEEHNKTSPKGHQINIDDKSIKQIIDVNINMSKLSDKVYNYTHWNAVLDSETVKDYKRAKRKDVEDTLEFNKSAWEENPLFISEYTYDKTPEISPTEVASLLHEAKKIGGEMSFQTNDKKTISEENLNLDGQKSLLHPDNIDAIKQKFDGGEIDPEKMKLEINCEEYKFNLKTFSFKPTAHHHDGHGHDHKHR